MKSFYENDYYEYKALLNYKLNDTECAYCGEKYNGESELKACKGCIKVIYCSKHCQKRHWNIHTGECDMI